MSVLKLEELIRHLFLAVMKSRAELSTLGNAVPRWHSLSFSLVLSHTLLYPKTSLLTLSAMPVRWNEKRKHYFSSQVFFMVKSSNFRKIWVCLYHQASTSILPICLIYAFTIILFCMRILKQASYFVIFIGFYNWLFYRLWKAIILLSHIKYSFLDLLVK